MGGKGNFDEVMLHKATLGNPLRSSLNSHFADLKAMEASIRQVVETPSHHSVQSLLKAHYARTIVAGSAKASSFNLAIPMKHRRTVSTEYERMRVSRPKPKLTLSPRSIPRISTSPQLKQRGSGNWDQGEESGVKSVRFAVESPSMSESKWQRTGSETQVMTPRPMTSAFSMISRRSEDLAGIGEHLKLTRTVVRKEKRVVKRKQRQLMRGLRKCSSAVDKALKFDIHGYIPKDLIEYKRKKAEERAAKGIVLKKPPVIHLRKEVVMEYRRDMLQKALQHNIDKDLRYIYTLGSCSANNT